MSDEEREPQAQDGEPRPAETSPEVKPETEALPEFAAARAAGRPDWSSGARPGRWATIGCGLAIVVLIGALFAGSTLLRRTVWTGFDGARHRLVANLPGNLPPGERMELTRNLDRFAAQLRMMEDPYPVMGEFQQRLRAVLDDGVVDRAEVAELNAFLESYLPTGAAGVPGAMP
ncbi:MAG TPA: hypothetical protein VLB51_15695 [Methylomirabilota bacterium]|nr:hypothetical protein [Methylomirabilota bacterium]